MKTKRLLATALRWAALVLLVAGLASWALTGANKGWTRTESTSMARDEITGLDYPVTTKAFQPGVDFLGASVAAAAVLGLAGWRLGRGTGKADAPAR